MRALTEIAPWGHCIIHKGKDVENRKWAADWMVGKRFAVHEGRKLDRAALAHLQAAMPDAPRESELVLGAVLGTVRFKGYVMMLAGSHRATNLTREEAYAALESPWRNPDAPFLWVLSDPMPLAKPIPCKGAQGFWHLPYEVIATMSDTTGREQRL